MRQIKCDGCQTTENSNVSRSEQTIAPVKFVVINDPRENIPDGRTVTEGDLCTVCRATLLDRFFGIGRERNTRQLELPRFMEPQSIRAAG